MELEFYEDAGRFFVSDLPGLPLRSCEKPPAEMPLFWLFDREPSSCRASFCVSDPRQLAASQESIAFLDPDRIPAPGGVFPQRLLKRINARALQAVNIRHPQFKTALELPHWRSGGRYRVHLLASGGSAGHLLASLKVLGGEDISSLGICCPDPRVAARLTAESEQISWSADSYDTLPHVESVPPDRLFDCEILLYAAERCFPATGRKILSGSAPLFNTNRKIVETYARQARAAHYRGLFLILSDPADLLCRAAYLASNAGDGGAWDGMGLLPEQIYGMGLGRVSALAAHLAHKNPRYRSFLSEGRCFGPRGAGLVVANSVEHYDEALSEAMTREILEISHRSGIKLSISCALSSGTMQLLLLLKGQWQYSSVCLGGTWIGCRNRCTPMGTEVEISSMPDPLFRRIAAAQEQLSSFF